MWLFIHVILNHTKVERIFIVVFNWYKYDTLYRSQPYFSTVYEQITFNHSPTFHRLFQRLIVHRLSTMPGILLSKYRTLSIISTYINTKIPVCVSVCVCVCLCVCLSVYSRFSRLFRNRLGIPLVQSFL